MLFNSKKACLSLFLAFSFAITLGGATTDKTTVRGVVKDKESGEPLIGAVIWVVDSQIGVSSDIDGQFSITFEGSYGFIRASLIGYQDCDKQIRKGEDQTVEILMEPDMTVLDEAVAIGYGTQKRASVIGSIATIHPEALKVPVSQLSNSLSGRLSGIISYQRTGEPGQHSTFYIRGLGTFGAGGSPLVLVDGIERELDLVDIEDVQDFSVLKDAAATAVYGVRGANGVVLITTRQGKEGKPKVEFKFEEGVITPTRVAQTVDGVTFSKLYNEAAGYDYYSQDFINQVANGSDPDLAPNVNWRNEIFKDVTTSTRANVNVSGGTSIVKYYISGAFYNENGLFKTDPTAAYNTGMYYRKFNFRSNVDVAVTERTNITMNLATTFEQKNQAGNSASTIWGTALQTPSVVFPMVYSNGQYTGPGDGGDNPYALLTQSGYRQNFYNNAQSSVTLRHDFSSYLTKGLVFSLTGSFDVNNTHNQDHTKTPEEYMATGRDADGNLITEQRKPGSQTLGYSYGSAGWRAYYLEAKLNYQRYFDKHNVGALLLYQMSSKNYVGSSASNSQASLPYRHMGFAVRATYDYDSRYFAEFNGGYNGSENFSPGHRFGFFPSVALGWMVSNENFWDPIRNVISTLKFKGSYGLVGNDQIGGGRRFIYLETISSGWQYYFGENVTTASSVRLGDWPNDQVGWEKSRKLDLGFDIGFLGNSLNVQFDWFREKRSGIFLERQSIPYFVGLNNKPWVNIGKMRNSGVDMSLKYDHEFTNGLRVSALGNFTFARNVIEDMDEPAPAEPYMSSVGQSRYEKIGYVADGLFKDWDDIASSPDQSYFGDIQPGDIKYKDLNGDGVINANDVKPIGLDIPEIVYGFGASVSYKGFDVSVFFQGNAIESFSMQSTLTYAFSNKYLTQSNILSDVADNHWTPERTDARYPRLTIGENTNNSQNSTFWMVDGSYLRLKNAEIGYTFPKKWMQKANIQALRIFVSGNNLAIFSPFKLWDPDQNVAGGASAYPITRTVNFGVNLNF